MKYLKFMPWLAAAAITLGSASVSSEVIFEEDFDNQPDFTSTMHTTTQSQYKDTHILPENWDALHQGTAWSPETGHPDKHASLEILASNVGKARGGQGKSMVNWRESNTIGWFTTPQTFDAGTWIRQQHMTAKTWDTEVNQSLTINGVTHTFTSRTAVDEASVTAPDWSIVPDTTFRTEAGRPLYERVTSSPIVITQDGTVVDPLTDGEFAYSNDEGANWSPWKSWSSDSQLVKLLPQQYKQLYVEFYISFSDNWYGRDNAAAWSSKFFRVGSWTGQGDVFNGANGQLGPIFLWDYTRNNYGVKNAMAFRGNPDTGNYYLNNSEPAFPRFLVRNYGDGSQTHNQVFGTGQTWTKIGLYVKLNSAPNATDGQAMVFLNDERVFFSNDIPWIKGIASTPMRGWNYFALGGNDYLQPFPNRERFEDWYSIDDVVVRNDLPSYLLSPSTSTEAPNPPSEISVD